MKLSYWLPVKPVILVIPVKRLRLRCNDNNMNDQAGEPQAVLVTESYFISCGTTDSLLYFGSVSFREGSFLPPPLHLLFSFPSPFSSFWLCRQDVLECGRVFGTMSRSTAHTYCRHEHMGPVSDERKNSHFAKRARWGFDQKGNMATCWMNDKHLLSVSCCNRRYRLCSTLMSSPSRTASLARTCLYGLARVC